MLQLVRDFNKKIMSSSPNKIDKFQAGDTITVGLKIVDGTNIRTQEFTGVCIARRNKLLGSNIIVRKISDGIEVERTVMLYSPSTEYIKFVSGGSVRRAKLYYLRGLKGKRARIKERKTITNKKPQSN